MPNRQDCNLEANKISSQLALTFYYDMLLGRGFEDACAQMYYRGKMFGFVHLYNGQEAISTGVIKSLKTTDYVCSTYRDHVHAISKGVPPRSVMAELFGKETGCSRGRGGSMHLFSSFHRFLGGFAFIGEGIPIALGSAFKSMYSQQVCKSVQELDVTVCFLGDGATNNGQFFECLNMAGLWNLPVIFVVENNQWAIGMAHHRSTSQVEIYKKAAAFGINSCEVDGMDVVAVHKTAKEAILKARKGDGPTLIEALTYRFRGHSLADPDELRSKNEKDIWISRDPIKNFQSYVIRNKLLSQKQLIKVKDEVTQTINDALQFAIISPEPKLQDLHKYVFTH
uniref:Pyruvate dehydrogenase E1 component subunit alpha n=1 Tax=Cyanidium caldarium TaxID=2771 RepID=Q9TLS2_CYACA|nr:pyruvate dehydrogenase E1 component alpha subunit [Cyanidium caldarium]AAF12897.1 unknown [Cyanidium caldarium]WDB00132.1 pyruvate dehydrogenase E1 component alpha subunit [Cyanidium caldarium]